MTKQEDRFNELDLMRFFAAMSVLVYHYKSKYIEAISDNQMFADKIYSFTKFGYLGVDLFFLISGFVILASAINRTCSQFAASRITRLYPTFWICMTITTLALISIKNYDITLPQYLANMTMFQEYVGIKNIDGVYWTLTTEIKFYICIFALIFLNLLNSYKVWLTIWLVITIFYLLFHQPFFMGWFISPYYSSYFIAGATFYLARRNGYELFHVVILVSSLIVSSVYTYKLIDSFSKNITINDRIIAICIVFIFYVIFLLISLKKIKLNYIYFISILGGLTYPIYLLHNAFGKILFDIFVEKVDPLLLLIIITSIVVMISYLIHIYLERLIVNELKVYLIANTQILKNLKRHGNSF